MENFDLLQNERTLRSQADKTETNELARATFFLLLFGHKKRRL